MKRYVLGVIALAATVAGGAPTTPVSYSFDQVKSKVVLVSSGAETRAARGTPAAGGDVVRTGWLGWAAISAPQHNARFEVYSSSEVTLGSDQPGVILKLERGKLKAMFDAITGNEPRVVATPGALLAVRGTRYGVEVDSKGNATLVVFEGIVDVTPRTPGFQPLTVEAGHACDIWRDRQPQPRAMQSPMTEREWGQRGSMMPGGGGMSPDGQPSKDPGTRSQPSTMGGHGHKP